jgi:uncharacterized membrane protein
VIGNLLFLLSDGLDSWADDNLEPSKVRMMVQMNTKGNIASGAVEDTAVAFLEKNLPEGYTYMVAGVAQVEIAITDLIVGAQTSSILISIIIVFLILSCTSNHPSLALVGTVPLSVSIMINFGLMGLFQHQPGYVHRHGGLHRHRDRDRLHHSLHELLPPLRPGLGGPWGDHPQDPPFFW